MIAALAAALALAVPPSPSGRVSDFAGALEPGARARLDSALEAAARGNSRQIAVAIFRSLDGESIEDASMRVAEKWKIGSRADDGVLLVVFVDDRALRIEVGYGLEDRLPDATCARILREAIVPRLQAGDLEGGLAAGVAAIDAAIGRAPSGKSAAARLGWSWDDLVGLVFIVLLAAGFILHRRWLFWFGGGWWGAGGRGGARGGGGFSGGGGSFGGGGASGKW